MKVYDYDKCIDFLIEGRKDKGWRQCDLGEAVYYSVALISMVESHKRGIKLDIFLLMLEALDYEIDIRPKKLKN